MKNKLQGLYGITNQHMLLDNQTLFTQVECALKGGMTLFQYRNKHLKRHQSLEDLMRLKELCHRYDALFIVNDDVDLCRQIAADGVHLGQEDANLEVARAKLGDQTIIGVSCYNDVTLARQAKEQGANYIAFGAFYPSPTKPKAPVASLQLLQQVQSLRLPVCAIGGINEHNAKALIDSGANMLAVISELFNANDVQLNAQKICLSLT